MKSKVTKIKVIIGVSAVCTVLACLAMVLILISWVYAQPAMVPASTAVACGAWAVCLVIGCTIIRYIESTGCAEEDLYGVSGTVPFLLMWKWLMCWSTCAVGAVVLLSTLFAWYIPTLAMTTALFVGSTTGLGFVTMTSARGALVRNATHHYSNATQRSEEHN